MRASATLRASALLSLVACVRAVSLTGQCRVRTRYEIPPDVATTAAPQLLEAVQTGPETLRWSAVAPALLAALLRGDCLCDLECACCATAVANHCVSLLNANGAAKNSWRDAAVVRAVLSAATGMLAADADTAVGRLHPQATQARPLPPPSPAEKTYSNDADRAYDAAIARVMAPAFRTGLRSTDNAEAAAALDELALAVLSLLRALHTSGLDCGLLSQYQLQSK